ncbi:hypothetical protein M426DRAFT_8827 [Hypoxylon sp. CI-4A]|nr:hypothetical protein M426DRAFT_8827 [Hypoxylon sp. CI-4A]
MAVKDIAATVRIDEDRLRRILKLLSIRRCFQEVDEDVYEHTSLSAFVAQNGDAAAFITTYAFLLLSAEEAFESSSLIATSIESAPYTPDVAHSAFCLRFGSPSYQWYTETPERSARFASAMAGAVELNRDTIELRDHFPWESLANKKVVGVGGRKWTHFHQFPELNLIVQDVSPKMLAQGPKRPEFRSVEKRVSFMQHDFYQPQPITERGSAPGTILLINDMVLPARNAKPKVEEHYLRQMDIIMMNVLAAKERTEKEFVELLKRADERFQLVKIHGQGVMGLVKFQLIQ